MLKSQLIVIILFSIITVCMPAALNLANASPSPNWDLTDIYVSKEAWDKDYAKALDANKGLEQLIKHPILSAQHFLKLLDSASATKKLIARLYTYASLKADEDLRIEENQYAQKQVSLLYRKHSAVSSLISAKVIALGPVKISSFAKQEPSLNKHTFFLKNIIRQQEHLDTPKHGKQNSFTKKPEAIFRHLQTKAIPWPTITLSDGQAATLTPAGYSYYRTQQNPADRIKVFDAYWNAIQPHAPLLAETLENHIQNLNSHARQLGYNTPLDAALAKENIPTSVYKTMLVAAEKNLPTLHRFLQLKKRLLGLSHLAYQDLYTPLSGFRPSFSLTDAVHHNTKALKPLGHEYLSQLHKGFQGQWMHTTPQSGKRSGAYMQDAAYDVHPYILLNFRGTYRDLNSFSHEWGHAMHSVYAQNHNPYETARYSSWTAELVAATNEILLEDQMITSAKTQAEKLYFLQEAIENIRRNFFQHALIATLELQITDHAANGLPLNAETLNKINITIQKQYWGHDHKILEYDPVFAITWAMMPQLYKNFQIYQYATGIAGAALLTKRLKETPHTAVENYLNLLKAGGATYPNIALEEAGINLDRMQSYAALFERMNLLIEQAEAILEQ